MADYETFDGSAFKVTEQEHAEKTIVGLPDVPGLSAVEMQQKLEGYTDFVAKEKLNGLIDRLGDEEDGVPTTKGMRQAINEAAFGESREETVFEYIDATLPDADATLSGSTVVIRSKYPRKGTDYDVQFTAPTDFYAEHRYVIDSADVALFDQQRQPLEEGWRANVPVTLTRRGDSAFFRAGGGAGGLDFAVIAVADKILLPLTARENTVAIISETAVPWYYIKDKQPVGEVEAGTVWIATGSNERLYFNPLKKNEIGIEPVMAYQYENGNWKNVAACIYLNGGWQDLNFEIYNHGVSPVAWSAGGVSGNGTGSNVIGDTGDYLRVYVSQSNSWYGGAIVSNTPIGMKGYRTLKFEVPYFVRGQGSGQIGIYTSRTILNVTTNAATSAVASLLIDLPGTYSFDITNLNGDYYVGLTARAGSTTRVSESCCTKIWME